jgi:hypothetical protein
MSALMTIAEHFFLNRYEKEYFTIQLINDTQLIQNTAYPDILNHFIKWNEQPITYEQKSNLLDVLLRHFKNNEKVQDIYLEMKGGKTNVYTDKQNVHDEDIYQESLTLAEKLKKWARDDRDREELDSNLLAREDWKDEYSWCVSIISKVPHVDDILTRAKIDTTMFGSFNIMDILLALVRYIDQSPHRDELLVRLGQEFEEMDGLCSSGYIVRLMNTLSGIDPDYTLTFPFKKQLSAVLSNLFSKAFQTATEDQINGSFVPEYQSAYLELIQTTVNSALPDLKSRYGDGDINKYILEVLVDTTSYKDWKYVNGRVDSGITVKNDY